MKELNENNTPDPKKIEKELGEFLNKNLVGMLELSPLLHLQKRMKMKVVM